MDWRKKGLYYRNIISDLYCCLYLHYNQILVYKKMLLNVLWFICLLPKTLTDYLQKKAWQQLVSSGPNKALMTLVIDTVLNVFVKPTELSESRANVMFHISAFPFHWGSEAEGEEKREKGERKKREIREGRSGTCFWRSVLMNLASPSLASKATHRYTHTYKQTQKHTHHGETLGSAFTYGITELFLVLLI